MIDIVIPSGDLKLEPKAFSLIQARIAQLVAYQLGTREVPDSNTGKGENFSIKKVIKFIQI